MWMLLLNKMHFSLHKVTDIAENTRRNQDSSMQMF